MPYVTSSSNEGRIVNTFLEYDMQYYEVLISFFWNCSLIEPLNTNQLKKQIWKSPTVSFVFFYTVIVSMTPNADFSFA